MSAAGAVTGHGREDVSTRCAKTPARDLSTLQPAVDTQSGPGAIIELKDTLGTGRLPHPDAPQWQAAQRRGLARQLSQTHGNRYLARLMAKPGADDAVADRPPAAAAVRQDTVFRWSEHEHKTFGDLAAQMAMNHDWRFQVGGENLLPEGVGARSDAAHENEETYADFTRGKVAPLRSRLREAVGPQGLANEGVGVAHYERVYTPVETPEGVTMEVEHQRRNMSFGDATMLGGDYAKTPEDLRSIQTVNPGEMASRMWVNAATNVNHFFPLAAQEWLGQYEGALNLAREAHVLYAAGNRDGGDVKAEEAFRRLGFATHFLQDTFASGHQYPRALDAITSSTFLGTALEGLATAKTYHDALCALPNGIPMQYGGSFHGDDRADEKDMPVAEESYRALVTLLSAITGKQVPVPPPRHNPGPDVAGIMEDREAAPVWVAMVNAVKTDRLPAAGRAAEEGAAGFETNAGTPYSAQDVVEAWNALGNEITAGRPPTTTVERLVDAALRGQRNALYGMTKSGMTGIGVSTDTEADDEIRRIIGYEAVPPLTHNQVVMVIGALLTGVCTDADALAILAILQAQADAIVMSVVRELTPERIESGIDGEEWDQFLALWAGRGTAGSNQGATRIVSEENDEAAVILTQQLSVAGAMNRLSGAEWAVIIGLLLSGRCGTPEEDAIVAIVQYLQTQGQLDLVHTGIGRSRMSSGVDGRQWRTVRQIMKDAGYDW